MPMKRVCRILSSHLLVSIVNAHDLTTTVIMSSRFTYRLTAVVLVATFALFTIGVPIVVASCPMPKSERAVVCAACYEPVPAGTMRYARAMDRSCCETKIAAERNATAFVHSFESAKSILALAVVPLFASRQSDHVATMPATVAASPPLPRDIPTFNASLLI